MLFLNRMSNSSPSGKIFKKWTICIFAAIVYPFLLGGTLYSPNYVFLTKESARDERPVFQDDSSHESLKFSINKSLNYFRRIPPESQFDLCGQKYSAAWLAKSLQTFVALIDHEYAEGELDRVIHEQFTVCKAADSEESEKLLVTGYFEPIYRGSLKKTTVYRYPLYTVPSDLAFLIGGSDFEGRRTGRFEKGRFVPYWTREEIEKNRLLVGHELVYLQDPIEVFILHVQGSGRVQLQDGSFRRVQYAGKNGRPYRSIGRFLVDEGKMKLDEVDLPSIVRYLREHPDEQQNILHHNESFVFFRWGNNNDIGPLGSLGEPLVAGRSVALDHKNFPPGILCFLQTQKPRIDKSGKVIDWVPMSRFVLNQDTGSAIQGPGRLDFFWGSGDYAATAAGLMKHPGKLYLLVKKK